MHATPCHVTPLFTPHYIIVHTTQSFAVSLDLLAVLLRELFCCWRCRAECEQGSFSTHDKAECQACSVMSHPSVATCSACVGSYHSLPMHGISQCRRMANHIGLSVCCASTAYRTLALRTSRRRLRERHMRVRLRFVQQGTAPVLQGLPRAIGLPEARCICFVRLRRGLAAVRLLLAFAL